MLELLSNIPDQIFGVIIGSGITLIVMWLNNREGTNRLLLQITHEKNQNTDRLYRERLEELYVESRKYVGSMITYYLPYRKVMQGAITYNDALDMTIDSGEKSDTKPHRVTMILDMYYPELNKIFDEFTNTRDQLNGVLSDYTEAYREGCTEGDQWSSLFQKLLEELGDNATNFVEAVAHQKPHVCK